MLDFIRAHPNLEHWSVYYRHEDDLPITTQFYVPNDEFQLLKLKSLCCKSYTIVKGIVLILYFLEAIISAFKNTFLLFFFGTEMIDQFVMVYPNVERLHLERFETADEIQTGDRDDECLSSIQFPNLITLSLEGFNLNGSFLLPVNNWPKTFSMNPVIISNSMIASYFQVITQCPKLERILLDNSVCTTNPTSIENLTEFLERAVKLRDLR